MRLSPHARRLPTLARQAPLVALLAASSAHAGVLTFTMENGNDGGQAFNTVFFSIRNDGVEPLVRFTMTVGDTNFLYDQLYLSRESFAGGDGSQTATLLQGDRTDDGAGPDAFQYLFVNFFTGVTFTGQWDIDFDSGAFDVNARTVLFNNGPAPNATITALFADGSSFVYEFPDLPSQDTYSLQVPGPAGGVLLAVSALAAARRGRRR